MSDPWAVHEQRADARMAAELAQSGHPWLAKDELAQRHPLHRLLTGSEEFNGSALMLLIRDAGRYSETMSLQGPDLRRVRWTVSRDDALLAATAALDVPDDWPYTWFLNAAVLILERAAGKTLVTPAESEVIRRFARSVQERDCLDPAKRGTLVRRLQALIPAGTGAAETEYDLSAFARDDLWAGRAAFALGSSLIPPGVVNDVVRQLHSAKGSKPTAAWLKGMAALDGEHSSDALRILLQAMLPTDADASDDEVTEERLLVSQRNADLARAAIWAASPLGGTRAWVMPVLRELADHLLHNMFAFGWMSCRKVFNALPTALGQLATDESIALLLELHGRTRDNGNRKAIASGLATAATARGLTPGQLTERVVPTGDLDGSGSRILEHGAVRARATLEPDLKLRLEWQVSSGWAARPAADDDTASVNAIKRLAKKEIRDVVAVQRSRMEGLLATGRVWDLADWRRYYLSHPIVGTVAQRLIWVVEPDDGEPMTVMPDGEQALPSSGSVRLWHPATASTAEVAAWRERLMVAGIVQPFKQAFREVYLLTDAERETGTYSNRFAAHILRYQQLYALIKERGWVANYLGPHDGGYETTARRELPDTGWTAMFEHAQAGPHSAEFTVPFASTDRVWFHRTGDRAREPVPLEEVPPLVLSEAMRDVDLFVGVTSIALDPEWADRGGEPYYGYWRGASFGELSASAQVRRDVLASVLPQLAVASQVELGDRYVRVRGRLATYRIHLGSANILIEPDDRYLCIVPSSKARTGRIMLPFEGDEVLALVLSKVLMLARDDRITDPSIVGQLPQRTA